MILYPLRSLMKLTIRIVYVSCLSHEGWKIRKGPWMNWKGEDNKLCLTLFRRSVNMAYILRQ